MSTVVVPLLPCIHVMVRQSKLYARSKFEFYFPLKGIETMKRKSIPGEYIAVLFRKYLRDAVNVPTEHKDAKMSFENTLAVIKKYSRS